MKVYFVWIPFVARELDSKNVGIGYLYGFLLEVLAEIYKVQTEVLYIHLKKENISREKKLKKNFHRTMNEKKKIF